MSSSPGELWSALASARPLVQCVTNVVSADLMANVLLACRCSPAMVADAAEAEEFATKASAVLVNVGTLSAPSLAGARAALRGAKATRKPWVLDPVAVGGTTHRTDAVASLVREFEPTVVKGNGSEVIALAKALGVLPENGDGAAAGRGVDAAPGLSDELKLSAARAVADALRCVVVATGEVDLVVAPTHGDDEPLAFAVRSGSELLPAVTATGCSLGALIAAFLAVPAESGGDGGAAGTSRVARAAAAACAAFGAAAKIAERSASGPGSFRVAFLDALWKLKGDDVDALGGVEVLRRE